MTFLWKGQKFSQPQPKESNSQRTKNTESSMGVVRDSNAPGSRLQSDQGKELQSKQIFGNGRWTPFPKKS